MNELSETASEQPPQAPYLDKQALYEALRQIEAGAIRQLHAQIAGPVTEHARYCSVGRQDTEEIVQDAILITIRKISDGSFQFLDYHPATYAAAVARNLLANFCRKRKIPQVDLETLNGFSDEDAHLFFEKKEKMDLLERALNQLGDPCGQLLRLRFFDNLKDEEVLRLGLTAYTTVDSLKNTRRRCLKKLANLLAPLRENLLES